MKNLAVWWVTCLIWSRVWLFILLGLNYGCTYWGAKFVSSGLTAVLQAATPAMLCAVVPLLTYGVLKEGRPLEFQWTGRAVAALLDLALAGSIAAFRLNYWLLKRMSTAAVLSMALVEPRIAVVLGAIVLGESVAPPEHLAAC